MSIRTIPVVLWLIAAIAPTSAQNKNTQFSRQADSSDAKYARIIRVDRAALLKNVDVIFNMQYADNNKVYAGADPAIGRQYQPLHLSIQ